MTKLPKECDILQIEEKWQKRWEEMGTYHFDWEDNQSPVYSVDTPPPYPSGDFHMGNVLNWTYFDMVARFKRMRGYNVFFPQGWDCHGLPTEVETEEHYGIKKTELPSEEFRKLCERFVNKYIGVMKNAIIRLGCSIDWTTEYKTMDPQYWRKTQLSFILLYKKDFIFRGTHIINWCPRCETAIADAEVEHDTREGNIYYTKFKLEKNKFLTIATTRPELLAACVTVAIHPNDERYQRYLGKEIEVPLVARKVKILTDGIVDPSFGTGVVMICTYGDKADVKVVAKHHLRTIFCIDKAGKMNEKAGKYVGKTVEEARTAIVSDLEESGLLEKTESIQQIVGVCWRCKTAVEILEQKQWFMKTRILTEEVEKNTLEINWYPDYMKMRLIDWARSLDWDWVISRQRIFATPIPIWYCKKCKRIIVAEPDWVPIDPRIEKPKIGKCPKCGFDDFAPETDVLDTWFDSSITCAVHAGWPYRSNWQRLFPADLHSSGADIIRTWAYYLMVRHLALFNDKPYKTCLINGMVLGSDGRKMSKSLGNYIATPEVFNKYGADAARQWAAGGGATGSDIPFRMSSVDHGWKFLIKLWNAARFVSLHLEDYKTQEKEELELLDRWLLSKLEIVTQDVTEAFENFQFNIALEEIRNFTWHVLCDCYIEAIKHRLYKVDRYGPEKRRSAQYALSTAVFRILQLLAPISPHITEEIYQLMYAAEKEYKSIHVSPWPKSDKDKVSEEAQKYGDLVMALIGEIRKDKAKIGKPLNTTIKELTIYVEGEESAQILTQAMQDIVGTCKVQNIKLLSGKGEGEEVSGHPNIQFVAAY